MNSPTKWSQQKKILPQNGLTRREFSHKAISAKENSHKEKSWLKRYFPQWQISTNGKPPRKRERNKQKANSNLWVATPSPGPSVAGAPSSSHRLSEGPAGTSTVKGVHSEIFVAMQLHLTSSSVSGIYHSLAHLACYKKFSPTNNLWMKVKNQNFLPSYMLRRFQKNEVCCLAWQKNTLTA